MWREVRRLPAKAALATRIWLTYASVRRQVSRRTLPDYVAALAGGRRRRRHYPVPSLVGAVDRCLRIGDRRPRCIVTALVAFRMLSAQGDAPELVIGLPGAASGPDAHAWVEVAGRDVGPPPGRGPCVPIARYAAAAGPGPTREPAGGHAVL